MKVSKKVKIVVGAVVAFLILLCFLLIQLIPVLGGNFNQNAELSLSPGADSLLKAAYQDVNPQDLRDYHTHIAGTGSTPTGCFVNPQMTSVFHPLEYLKFRIYLNSSGISDFKKTDEQFVARLLELIRKDPRHGKFCILAFDQNYNKDGTVNLSKTEFFVPNDYVVSLAAKYPDAFIPCISIHPYRKDAVAELERFAKMGAKQIKWLPNAMGIDPSDPKCEGFYAVMKKYDMVLLSHAGHEKAVHAEEDQRYGNPLLLRKPLDMGVKVIMAHCASLGENIDLDSPDKKNTENFDLFIRMMNEEKYKGLLFGDISAMTQYNRLGKPLLKILQQRELSSRLVNGSDYPLPAINAIIRTKDLCEQGFISPKEREYLNEIYKCNPLIFDYVLKRTIHDPSDNNRKLPASLFKLNAALGY
jgi:predicted TIM-barrel fold metal-dependent hydrolase